MSGNQEATRDYDVLVVGPGETGMRVMKMSVLSTLLREAELGNKPLEATPFPLPDCDPAYRLVEMTHN